MATKRSARQTYARIRDTSNTLRRIDASKVQSALGAEPVDWTLCEVGGPLSLMQVRQEILERLQSTGGRPSLSDTSQRVKIPLNKRQWQELEDIASEVRSPGFAPSAGQIASVLITLSLRALHKRKEQADAEAVADRQVVVH